MNSRELIAALKSIETEKGIDKETIFTAIENSLVSACKKNFGTSQNIKVEINRKTGEVNVFAQKEVTEDVYDAFLEISLEDAREINPNYEYGDIVDIPISPKNFGRISAQTAKQVVVQKFREAEREKLFNEFITKEKDIDTAIIKRITPTRIIVSLGKVDAILFPQEQVKTENYKVHDRIKVYILEVKQTTKGPQITVSRTHYDLVKRLFELEVPEVFEGIVEIKSIAREAGSRTKIAVYCKNSDIDPVGACVGQNGSRVNVIVDELNGEKIDIINWSDETKIFVAEALKPANVIALQIEEINNEKTAKVVVSDEQLSLAIGKSGQNVRLAAKLTGCKIDIKSETDARETNFIDFEDKSLYISNQTEQDLNQ